MITHYKREYPSAFDLQFLMQNMFVLPIHFSKEDKNKLTHCKQLFEYNSETIAIYPRFNKLIVALRTAVENGEGMLDKDATSCDDAFDSFRLSLLFWHQ